MCLQADFEPNSRKLRGHERIPAIYESEVCFKTRSACDIRHTDWKAAVVTARR